MQVRMHTSGPVLSRAQCTWDAWSGTKGLHLVWDKNRLDFWECVRGLIREIFPHGMYLYVCRMYAWRLSPSLLVCVCIQTSYSFTPRNRREGGLGVGGKKTVALRAGLFS